MKHYIILMLVTIAILPSCGYKALPQEFISASMKEVTTDVKTVSLELTHSDTVSFKTSDCLIYDTLAFSYVRNNDYIISVSNLLSGKLLGNFCKRGRACNELIDALPLQEVYLEDGDLKTDLISYHDSKVFVWNITKSLQYHRDIYDSIIQLDANNTKTFSIISYRRIDDLLFCYDSKQTQGHNKDDAPEFSIYSLNTGQKIKNYDIFKVPAIKFEKGVSYRDYCTNRFTINKDRPKSFVVFDNFPVYCLINLLDGSINSMIFKDLEPFSLNIDRWYFADVQSDDSYVYALYSGEELYNGMGTDIPNTLFIFDWNGTLKLICNLSDRFTEILIDNGWMYLIHYEGKISKYPLKSITDNIL